MDMVILFFGVLALSMLVHGQDQSGFISIDCGINEGSDYTDENNGLLFTSDTQFIDTGINGNIASEFMSENLGKRLETVRSFPEGAKNCYTLRPTEGKDHNYLIRVAFMYGNYDSKNQLPEFKLHLGVEEWGTITFTDSGTIFRREIIHVPKTDDIYVCLVNIGLGTPFISLLELRPLNDSIYITESGSLELVTRADVGSTANQAVRYKNDVYDRVWLPMILDYWLPLTTAYSNDTLSDNEYRPPSNVMSTAVIPSQDDHPLDYDWGTYEYSQQFYVYMYVAELYEDLPPDQLREFNISMNGGSWIGPIIPEKMIPTTILSTISIHTPGGLNFSIAKTNRSTLPPILNALEIYSVKQFLQSPTIQNEVDAIKNIKSVYKVMKSSWKGDPCVPRNYTWSGLICSDNGFDAPNIISLNLSWSNLAGKIIDSFFNLTSVKYLDLSNNKLTGEVPTFLAELASLKTLNLSWNNFTGSVPLALIEKSNAGTLSLSLDGNPNLCKTNSCESKKNKKNAMIPIVSSVVSVLVLSSVAIALFWIYKRRQQQGTLVTTVKPKDQEEKIMGQNNRQLISTLKPNDQKEKMMRQNNIDLSYKEIVSITGNFKKMIGKGGFGKVYSGRLSDGTQVAVKMLSSPSTHGFKQCWTEAQLLRRIHHKNLVTLLGYCDEGETMGLIYEYMANGNLQEYLSGTKKDASVLSWEQRLRIAIDAAQALEYLHNGCRPPIIHRDVKTANILLDKKLQAKVADFGLSKYLPSENGSYLLSGVCLTTAVAGTPGYLDPEYYATTKLNEKSDVYSFGIVLLELVTGRPPIIKEEESFIHIVHWVSPILERKNIKDIVDHRLLRGDFEINSVWKVLETAMTCVARSSSTRPTMSYVLQELKGCLNTEMTRERKEDNKKQSILPWK